MLWAMHESCEGCSEGHSLNLPAPFPEFLEITNASSMLKEFSLGLILWCPPPPLLPFPPHPFSEEEVEEKECRGRERGGRVLPKPKKNTAPSFHHHLLLFWKWTRLEEMLLRQKEQDEFSVSFHLMSMFMIHAVGSLLRNLDGSLTDEMSLGVITFMSTEENIKLY